MKKATFRSGTREEAEKLLKKTEKGPETKRVQCVLFGERGFTSEMIAPLVGFSSRHVRDIWRWYRKGGWKRLLGEGRGKGRNKAHLTLAEEKEFLATFEEKAASGDVITAKVIQLAHADLVGRELDETVTYRLLQRHGWTKKTARPQHPKHDPEALKKFKRAIFPPGYDSYEDSSNN